MTLDAWAVVVARTGPTAKSRLAPLLTPPERAALAAAMLGDVLAACRAADLTGTIAVVSSSDGARVAVQAGAVVIRDEMAGMNAAVALGVRAAATRGAEVALVLPGDVPLVDPIDLRVLLDGHLGAQVVVVPDHAGVGTNALLLRPPDAIAPAFEGASAERHLRAAALAGLTARWLPLHSLAFDLDAPADLAVFDRMMPGPSTAAALADLPLAAPSDRA